MGWHGAHETCRSIVQVRLDLLEPARSQLRGSPSLAKAEPLQTPMALLDHDPTVRIELLAERLECLAESLVASGAVVERQDVDIEEEVLAQEWKLHLHEPASDAPVARSHGRPNLPVV